MAVDSVMQKAAIVFSRPTSSKRIAAELYSGVVTAARAPAFYAELGVPDTVEGRYEMIVLHVVLLLRRMRQPGAGQKRLSQALVDFMAADLDRSIRELGVGDMSVGKFMKRLGEGLYGRAAVAAYGAGLTRTLLLTYNPALFTAGAACLVAALAVLAIGRPKRVTPPVPAAA